MKQHYALLVVDNEEGILQLVGTMLRNSPFKVIPVRSGREALLTATNMPIDIVLLDILMPDLSGVTVCGHMRATPHLQGIPIVMLTALDDYATRRNAVRAGATDLLTKPVSKEELLSKLTGVIAEYEANVSPHWDA
jgi:DNA-binding response OmpR family regulator